MSGRAPVCEKWRSIGDWRGRRRLDAAGLHRRKVWQTGRLRSGAVGSEHGEMALWSLEKPPLGAIFDHFFDDFLGVFLRACPSGRYLARMRPRKALVTDSCCQSRVLASSLEPSVGWMIERGPDVVACDDEALARAGRACVKIERRARSRAPRRAVGLEFGGRFSAHVEQQIRTLPRNFLETRFIQKNDARRGGSGWRAVRGHGQFKTSVPICGGLSLIAASGCYNFADFFG